MVLAVPAARVMGTFMVVQVVQAPVGAKVMFWATPLISSLPVREVVAPRAKRTASVAEPRGLAPRQSPR